MISKNKIKYIHSLESNKVRKATGVFVAEGSKTVLMLLERLHPELIIATKKWFSENEVSRFDVEKIEVDEEELRKTSLQQHPQDVIAVFKIPAVDTTIHTDELSLALDGVQDPGNLGTIIRTADWFGIKKIFCSQDTVSVYNPKTIQSTMGSIAHVDVVYTDLSDMINKLPEGFPVYGTTLDGDNIYGQKLPDNGLIIMGNEGKGLSESLRKLVTHKLFIPPYPTNSNNAESLNVAVATAIICNEFRRK